MTLTPLDASTFPALIQRAEAALAEAKTLPDVKDVRDKAETLRRYVTEAGYSQELATEFAMLRLRAERTAGEMLATTIQRGGDPKATRSTLADLGVSKFQSRRWQKLAAIPGDRFEWALKDVAEHGELTTSAVLRCVAEPKPKQAAASSPLERIRHLVGMLGKAERSNDPPACAEYATQILDLLVTYLPSEVTTEPNAQVEARPAEGASLPVTHSGQGVATVNESSTAPAGDQAVLGDESVAAAANDASAGAVDPTSGTGAGAPIPSSKPVEAAQEPPPGDDPGPTVTVSAPHPVNGRHVVTCSKCSKIGSRAELDRAEGLASDHVTKVHRGKASVSMEAQA